MKREGGWLLIDALLALTLLTVGLLGFLMSFAGNSSSARIVDDRDEARVALERIAETLRSADFSTVYQNYNWAAFEVPELETSWTYTSGGTTYSYSYPSYAWAIFYVNELALPSEFGPILDIDGSGGLNNTNCSSSYKILPVRLFLMYTAGNFTDTRDLFLVLRGET